MDSRVNRKRKVQNGGLLSVGLVQFAKTCEKGMVALLFLFNKHCPIIE